MDNKIKFKSCFSFSFCFPGTVCSRMGDDIKAVDYLNKAVALGKDTASENLSTFLVNLGKITKSIGFIDKKYSAQWIFNIFPPL